MSKPLRVLILEDYESDAMLLQRELRRGGFSLESTIIDNADDLHDALQNHEWDVILSDYSMPGFDAISALKIAQQYGGDIPFIIISGTVGEDVAVTAMKAGAHDFFAKGNLQRLVPAVERELRDAQERKGRRTAERLAQASLDALSAHIAILDDTGEIIAVNQAWVDFAHDNTDKDNRDDFIGYNYLTACDNVSGADAEIALAVASGIRAIIAGTQDYFELEYPCHFLDEQRWYTVKITRFRGNNPIRVVVAHENVTEGKLAQQQIKRANDTISLLRDIAIASNSATSINEVLQVAIDRICLFANCEIGHAYIVPTTDEIKIESLPIWHLLDNDCFDEFKTTTDNDFKTTHQSLIRDVLDTKQVKWLDNISKSDEFVRSDIAAKCGLRCGLAFPIIAYDKVVGILEFFTTQSFNDTIRELIVVTSHIGTQIGRVIERQHSERALLESEERYRALFERSLSAVYIHDFEGNFIDANQAALDLLGYQKDDLKSLNFISLLSEDELEKAIQILERVVHHGYQSEPAEFRVLTKDNQFVDVEIVSSLVYQDGEPWAIQGIARDITQQKEAYTEEQNRRIIAEALSNTTAMVLADDIDRQHVLNIILQYTTKLIPSDAATLMEVHSGVARVVDILGHAEKDLQDMYNFRLVVEDAINLRTMSRTRKPFIVNDTEDFPEWRTDLLSQLKPIRSNLSAPIFIRDTLFGFINLDSFTPNHFTQSHADQLALLSTQAAVAIHNAEQYEQKRQYARRLELLHQIDQAILRADRPETIANNVLIELQSVAGCHSLTVTLFDLPNRKQTILATTTTDTTTYPQGTTYPLTNEELLDTLQQKTVYAVNALPDKQSLTQFEKELIEIGIKSYVCIPLIVGDVLLGSLNFRAEETHGISAEMLDIALEITAQLAIALENTRLQEIEQRRNSELTAIHQASLQLTSTLDLEIVLHTIIDYAILLIEAHDAHIYLYDGQDLTFGAAQWDGKRQSHAIAQPRVDGLTNRVAKSAKRIIINDLSEHSAYRDIVQRGALIGLPLTVSDKVNGVMTLAFVGTHEFDEHEIRLLELLADQAAIAIHNAQLYKQIRTHADELENRVIERTRQLQNTKERIEGILNVSNDSLILTNMKGIIYQTNPGFDETFGYHTTQILEQPIETILAPDSVDQFLNDFRHVVENKSSQRVEIVARRRDGETFPVDALLAPIVDGDNVDVVCSLRDISLQKQVEVELREALEREQELSKLKTQFTSIVSHEFRTPLAVILSSSDLLLKYSDRFTPERQQAKLQQINHQVQRLTRLMDDVLMITQNQTVGFDFKPKRTNLLQLCETIIEEVQVRNQADIPIIFTHEGNCRDVMVDEFLFTHILQNLGSNAVKYSKSNGQVFIHLHYNSKRIVLTVEDEGIGIPEEHQTKLFESFQRAANVGQIQGTGIGMTIVKQAVDAYGGTIEFTSIEDEGTKFIVTLPNELGEIEND